MPDYERVENKIICKECGGACCKGGGCAYLSTDLKDINIEIIESLLDEGRASIAATLSFKYINGSTPIAVPTLFIRARNINRDAVDLVSIPSACLSLEEEGCYFDLEHRPSCGATMIPKKSHLCHTDITREDLIASWEPYQNLLSRIVKRRTKMSVHQKIRLDVIEYIYQMLSLNNLEENEIYRMARLSDLSSFEIVFPAEYQEALTKVKNEDVITRNRALK